MFPLSVRPTIKMNGQQKQADGLLTSLPKEYEPSVRVFSEVSWNPPDRCCCCCCSWTAIVPAHRHLNITFQAISTDSSLVGYYKCTTNASHQVCCCRRRVRCGRINAKIDCVCSEVSFGEKQLLRGAGDCGLAQRLSGFCSDRIDNFIICL